MKNLFYTTVFLVFVVVSNTGCVGTIYSAVHDERNIKTIASDSVIETKILKELAVEKSSDLMDVAVTSYKGDVFLVGEYRDNKQKERFLNATKDIDGVKSVDGYFVKVNKNHPCDTKKDLGITAEVKGKLIADSSIWSTNIEVSTIQCKVILWGTVGSSLEIKKAIKHAKDVKDIETVKSFLKTP